MESSYSFHASQWHDSKIYLFQPSLFFSSHRTYISYYLYWAICIKLFRCRFRLATSPKILKDYNPYSSWWMLTTSFEAISGFMLIWNYCPFLYSTRSFAIYTVHWQYPRFVKLFIVFNERGLKKSQRLICFSKKGFRHPCVPFDYSNLPCLGFQKPISLLSIIKAIPWFILIPPRYLSVCSAIIR